MDIKLGIKDKLRKSPSSHSRERGEKREEARERGSDFVHVIVSSNRSLAETPLLLAPAVL